MMAEVVGDKNVIISVCFGENRDHSLIHAGAVMMCPRSSEGNLFWCEKAPLYKQVSHAALRISLGFLTKHSREEDLPDTPGNMAFPDGSLIGKDVKFH